MKKKAVPTVACQMMIRKPVSMVFQAFIDPDITTKFWFTKSSGQLETGKRIIWEWEMYHVSSEVLVKEIVPNEKISVEWDNTPDTTTTVDFEFTALTADTTYVVIKNYGFHQTGDDLVQAVMDNAGGFTTVLDGLKAWLEFGIELNLVRDKFPSIQQK
ncbi:SRPBCC family protein [Parapedobacter deserti]|uniref:SRPBCC family protein n=1 Tax=Parapedobacter deserti TaxID=1912957 RepID=A0ABV7JS14_9SPHI